MSKTLSLDGHDYGVIHGKKVEDASTIWLTEKSDGTWCVIVRGPRDDCVMELIRPPQEQRAREIYADLSLPHVLSAFLEGRDS